MAGELRKLPGKIEKRLADLVEMEEFDMEEVEHCRRTYWDDREGWHSILINCYERAKEGIGGAITREGRIG